MLTMPLVIQTERGTRTHKIIVSQQKDNQSKLRVKRKKNIYHPTNIKSLHYLLYFYLLTPAFSKTISLHHPTLPPSLPPSLSSKHSTHYLSPTP